MFADRIKSDMTKAMKAGDSLRLSVLRMLSSELGYKKIDVQRELIDEDVVGVVGREVKKRREAIAAYKAAGRVEQMEKEQQELAILEEYAPKMMNEEEIRNEILEIREIQDIKDFGQIMKIVAPRFKGRADGSLVARIMNEKISKS